MTIFFIRRWSNDMSNVDRLGSVEWSSWSKPIAHISDVMHIFAMPSSIRRNHTKTDSTKMQWEITVIAMGKRLDNKKRSCFTIRDKNFKCRTVRTVAAKCLVTHIFFLLYYYYFYYFALVFVCSNERAKTHALLNLIQCTTHFIVMFGQLMRSCQLSCHSASMIIIIIYIFFSFIEELISFSLCVALLCLASLSISLNFAFSPAFSHNLFSC